MKKLTTELAAEITERIASIEIREVIAATEKAAESDTGTFEVVITTENVDRYGEVIKLDAWELEHFKSNPVVLWGHDHKTLPIGMSTGITSADGKLVAKGKFAPHEHAQQIRKLYDLGIVRATSVGFIEKEREGNLITKAELIEFSFVSVPANPYALSLAMEKELNINELVTKGFFSIETRDAEEPVPPTVPESEDKPEEEAPETEPAPEEKAFGRKAVEPILAQLKAAVGALEALGDEEPERTDDTAAPVDETPEGKSFREFTEKRRIVQDAATVLGDVLADARRALESR